MAVIQYCGKVRPKLWKTQKMKNYIIKLKIKISCTIITCGILAPGAGTPEILADVQVVPPVNIYNVKHSKTYLDLLLKERSNRQTRGRLTLEGRIC